MTLNRIATYLIFSPAISWVFFLSVFTPIERWISIWYPDFPFFMGLIGAPAIAGATLLALLVGVIIKMHAWLKGRAKFDGAWVNLWGVLIASILFILNQGSLNLDSLNKVGLGPVVFSGSFLVSVMVVVLLEFAALLFFLHRRYATLPVAVSIFIILVTLLDVFVFMRIQTSAVRQKFIDDATHHGDILKCASFELRKEVFVDSNSDCLYFGENGEPRSMRLSKINDYGYSYELIDEVVVYEGFEQREYTLRLTKNK